MNIFQTNRVKPRKKTKFNLSHESKLSFNMADLIPVMWTTTVPGDRMKLHQEIMIRMAPLMSPVMHRLNVYTYQFFVPFRLIWDEWEDFITSGPNGDSKPVSPFISINDSDGTSNNFEIGSLADYLGVPPFTDNDINGEVFLSSLPFRAYQLIYNEYFRDQNLEKEIPINTVSGVEIRNFGYDPDVDGSDSDSYDYLNKLLKLRKKAWEKDYFTSALPWTQRGEDVRLPLGDGVVKFNPEGGPLYAVDSDGNPITDFSESSTAQNLRVQATTGKIYASGSEEDMYGIDPNNSLIAELPESTTINEFRRSLAIQRWLEKNARYGSRYIEQILSHFGVRTSDYRLQRPQFLGAGSSPVVISEVLQTSQSSETSPQGYMAGHGISVGNTHGFRSHRFEEHGIVMTLMCVMPRTQYFQGLSRDWTRTDNFEYYWPDFAHLGEQPIFNHELYWKPDEDLDIKGVFGYQSRYAEYKWKPSTVHGEFRNTLDFWHMARKFDNMPKLNKEFVIANPTDRIYAVRDESAEKLYCQIYHNFKALRPMPKYGTPMI